VIRGRALQEAGQTLQALAFTGLLTLGGMAHAWPLVHQGHPVLHRNAVLQDEARFTYPMRTQRTAQQGAPQHTNRPQTLVIDAPPQAPVSQPHRSPAEAARWAKQANGGGRVLAVYPSQTGYRVKLLKDGEVSVVDVPD
jgi:hypothetical protein